VTAAKDESTRTIECIEKSEALMPRPAHHERWDQQKGSEQDQQDCTASAGNREAQVAGEHGPSPRQNQSPESAPRAFGNDDHWIDDAMRLAFRRYGTSGLDVRIVSYGAISPSMLALAAEFGG
jgi:hypothetical protein